VARHLRIRWCVNDKRKPGKNLSSSQKMRNRKQSSIRARRACFPGHQTAIRFSKDPLPRTGEKRLTSQLAVGLANLYMLRRQLMAA
jgi:IS5 family transposase